MRGCGTAEDDPAGDDHNPYRQPLSGEWTWKDDWKSEGWKRGNGQELKNADLWQQLERLLQPYAVRFKVESMLPYSKTGST